jgi:carboxylesterase type B
MMQPPLSYGKWDGTLDATKTSPACAQYDFIWQKLTGQEDCLFLNIYTPSLPKKVNESLLNVKLKKPSFYINILYWRIRIND